MRLYLVRHGETMSNIEGRIQGHLDAELNETGKLQARLLARRLQGERFKAIYSSDLSRAWMTADVIAQAHELPVHRTELLREAMLGVWQGHTSAELAEIYPEEFRKYKFDPIMHRPPGGERLEDVIARCQTFVEEVVTEYPAGNLLAVGHGGSIRGIICAVFGFSPQFYRRIKLDNASITIIDLLEDRPVLVGLNDLCHLEDAQMADEPQEY